MLRSIGKQSRESVQSVWKKKYAMVGRICRIGMFKPRMKEWGLMVVTYDENGEPMELMEEVPLKRLGESELERLVHGWWREGKSWFQRRGEAYRKEQSVICREDDVDGRASVTKDEERVLWGG